jgi:hypothetical protein
MPFARKLLPEQDPAHAGRLMFASIALRNFYGLWHADNPHPAVGIDDNGRSKMASSPTRGTRTTYRVASSIGSRPNCGSSLRRLRDAVLLAAPIDGKVITSPTSAASGARRRTATGSYLHLLRSELPMRFYTPIIWRFGVLAWRLPLPGPGPEVRLPDAGEAHCRWQGAKETL